MLPTSTQFYFLTRVATNLHAGLTRFHTTYFEVCYEIIHVPLSHSKWNVSFPMHHQKNITWLLVLSRKCSNDHNCARNAVFHFCFMFLFSQFLILRHENAQRIHKSTLWNQPRLEFLHVISVASITIDVRPFLNKITGHSSIPSSIILKDLIAQFNTY